jgi:nucleotide-binding universal stress UspA family protein
MSTCKSILVPIDFADCSKRAVELALEIAAATGAKIKLIHVWLTPAYVSPSVAIAIGRRTESFEELARREAQSQFTDFIQSIPNPREIPLEFEIIYGSTHDVILDAATKHDLVVMGTHGRRGVARFALGSVTEKVIRACTRPVLVVNAQMVTPPAGDLTAR